MARVETLFQTVGPQVMTADLVYILSPSYSGSTLLTILLATHPEICTVGELKASALGDTAIYRCSCGSLLEECHFWVGLRLAARQAGIDFEFQDFKTHFGIGPHFYRKLMRLVARNRAMALLGQLGVQNVPAYHFRLKDTVARNEFLIDFITKAQKGRIFLDSSKDPERLAIFRSRLKRKIKVIYLLRDGRGVTNSYIKHYAVSMSRAAREWLATQRACDQVLRRFPKTDIVTVRYEDLCADPEETLGRVLEKIDLEYVPVSSRKPVGGLHILGNDMRLSFSNAITPDQKWKLELQKEDHQVFDALAGWRNRLNGYSPVC